MTEATFNEMDDQDIQALLKTHHIVVTEQDKPKYSLPEELTSGDVVLTLIT